MNSTKPRGMPPHRAGKAALAALLLSLAPGAALAQAPVEDKARELAEALSRIDPSYAYHGLRAGHGSAVVGGSSYRRPAQPPAVPRPRSGTRPDLEWLLPPADDR